ncbi:MAG: hypothetical protein GY953_17520, partial [bacterium]|nr:hypothetical protein [bacterium]
PEIVAEEQQAAAEDDADKQQATEPHLEVVDPPESTADISDKVDRLLEELREVT